jgi:heme exporter protein C
MTKTGGIHTDQQKPVAARWAVLLGIVLLVGGAAGIIAVMHHAMFGLPSHMPTGSITIFGIPTTPGGNNLNLYESYRIFFLHVPSAYTAAMVSGLMFIGGIGAIMTKRQSWELFITASAQIGLASCLVTMLTGYFWGDFAWMGNLGGWNFKDPRLNATLVLWLSYVALVLIRGAIDDPTKRREFVAVYGLLTVPLYPLVNQAIKMFGKVAHPESLKDLMGDGPVKSLLNYASLAVVAFFAGFLILLFLRLRVHDEVQRLRGVLRSRVQA